MPVYPASTIRWFTQLSDLLCPHRIGNSRRPDTIGQPQQHEGQPEVIRKRVFFTSRRADSNPYSTKLPQREYGAVFGDLPEQPGNGEWVSHHYPRPRLPT